MKGALAERGRALHFKMNFNTLKIFESMKKIEYLTPEMETIKLNYCKLICGSGDEPPYIGPGNDDILPD